VEEENSPDASHVRLCLASGLASSRALCA